MDLQERYARSVAGGASCTGRCVCRGSAAHGQGLWGWAGDQLAVLC